MRYLRNREILWQTAGSAFLLALFSIFGFLTVYLKKEAVESAASLPFFCAAILLLEGLLLLAFWLAFTAKRYKKLEQLASEADRMLHGERNLNLEQYQEGELSILANELQKLLSCLLVQAETLKQDKIYLSDSLADISHQLKTPLTSLQLLMARLSKEEDVSERRRLTYEGIKLLDRIDWLVNALLKISKIDAGTAVFAKEWVDIKELAQQALEPLRIPMELREQKVILKFQEETKQQDAAELQRQAEQTGPGFSGDSAWSVEALGNILKNCMEHTPAGGTIWICGQENRLYTEIRVEDNGCGIAGEDLPHLFERFYKGKDASESSVGIGLALARMIIREQNGTIKAENRKEGGARFTIRFYKGVV